MPTSAHPQSWGRSPLVALGLALAGALAALVLVASAAAARSFGALALAALFLLGTLLALAVAAILLLRDRFPAQVMRHLRALEDRVRTLEGGVVGAPGWAAPSADASAGRLPETPPPPPAVAPAPAPATPEPAPPRPPASVPPTPARAGDSWELALGGRWLGRLGIVVLLVGIGLFLKFGWDQGWFRPTPTVRVLLGLGLGLVLLASGETARRRERYRLLSQILTAGGIGAVYLSTWAAHGLYGLVSAAAAFVLLAAAAGLGVAVAVATGGRAVAALATVGGFLVPAVVHLDPLPVAMLYALVLVLDLAVLGVAVARRWPELGGLALIGSVTVLVEPLAMAAEPAVRARDAVFLLVLVAVFVGVSVGRAAWRRVQPGRLEVGVLAAAALAGWGAGLWRLHPLGARVGGAWTLTVLLLLLLAAGLLLRRLGTDGAARRALLGVVLVLGVALPPVVWNGAEVAAGWALEALLLVLAGTRTGVVVLSGVGAGVVVLAVAAAVTAAEVPAAAPFGNRAALLRLVAGAALAGVLVLLERWRGAGAWREPFLVVAAPGAAAVVLAWLLPESVAAARRLLDGPAAEALIAGVLAGVLIVLGGLLLAVWGWRPATATSLTGVLLLAVALLIDPTAGWRAGWAGAAAAAPLLWAALAVVALAARGVGDDRSWCRAAAIAVAAGAAVLAIALRASAAWPGDTITAAGAVPAGLLAGAGAALLAAAALARDWPQQTGGSRIVAAAGWVLVVAGASRLVATAVALAGPVPTLESRRAAVVALSVLWGAAGLAFVLGGLARRAGHLRVVGLGLLVVTAAKVFLWDLASAATVIRIVAFLATGGALVAGSYLYARFREYLEVRS